MISIVLYGRNDTYGYNLHKRAALSLNCMAEVLTDPDDEILFVDYNTPNDYPTFPEAIEDTLTAKAKKLLRILRVRPEIHARYEDKTHLKALEPISRNIAVRRSNPSNRWILSTNTDMIFLPKSGPSLTEIIRLLEDGYWAVPRYEIPESLWESFDRMDPSGVIKAVDYWGRRAHLNEIVLGCDENLFDAPGDFQLMPREVLFKINGFDERMLLGWHVDSNIAKRLNILFGKTSDLSQEIYGYHCDHTRQITPMHRHKSIENSLDVFVDSLSEPILEDQRKWGCSGEEIEEIRIGKSNTSVRYAKAIQSAVRSELHIPSVSSYRPEGYDRVNYDPDHVVTFLADLFVNLPSRTTVVWFGYRKETLDVFRNAWNSLGFSGEILLDHFFAKVLLDEKEDVQGIRIMERDDALDKAELFVVDFGIFGDGSLSVEKKFTKEELKVVTERSRGMVESFFAIMENEYSRIWSGSPVPRRVVTINAFFNRFENMVRSTVGTARTPFCTRIQQGYLLPRSQYLEEDLLPQMLIGPSGRRESGGEIHVLSDGPVFYGPYLILLSGMYVLEGEAEFAPGPYNEIERGYLEVVRAFSIDHQEPVVYTHVYPDSLGFGNFSLAFDVPGVVINPEGHPATYEFRFYGKGKCSLKFRSLKLRRIRDVGSSPSFIGEELLPRLSLGDAGKLCGDGFIESRVWKEGHLCFGPYLSLPEGRYRLNCRLKIFPKKFWDKFMPRKEMLYLEAVYGIPSGTQTPFASIELSSEKRGEQRVSLEFEVNSEMTSKDNIILYEFRLWTNGLCRLNLSSVVLEML